MAIITGSNRSDFRFGTFHGDTIHGLKGNDWLFGLLGNDWIFGDEGHDKLFGGFGNDYLTGGEGNDGIDGGFGFDTALFAGSIVDYKIEQHRARTIVTDLAPGIDGNDGVDTLTHVELLQFSDYALYLDGRNNIPFAQDDHFATDEDAPLTIHASDLLANDLEFDSDPISIASIDTSATLGTLIDNHDGTFTYDGSVAFASLGAGDSAVDSFLYKIDDGRGGTATATAFITVNGVENNLAPVAELALLADGTRFLQPALVTFDASASFDPDGSIVSYEWDIGDGSNTVITTFPFFDHIYAAAGEYTATVTVTDDVGATDTATFDFSVEEPGDLIASFSNDPNVLNGIAPFTVTFTNTSTSENTEITDAEWDFGDDSPPVFVPASSLYVDIVHTYTDPGFYIIKLTIFDNLGRDEFTQKFLLVEDAAVATADVTVADVALVGVPASTDSFHDLVGG